MISLQMNNNIIIKQVTRLLGISTPIQIFKRFYPGGGSRNFLSPENCNRILRVFNKTDILKNKFTIAEIHTAMNDIYKMHGNAHDFFKTIKEITNNGEIDINKNFIGNLNSWKVLDIASTFRSIAELNIRQNIILQAQNNNSPLELKNNTSITQKINKEALNKFTTGVLKEIEEKEFNKKHNDLITKMTQFEKEYMITKKINWKLIWEWKQYLDNRTNRSILTIKFTSDEHHVDLFLEKIFQENTTNKQDILFLLKHKLDHLKIQSNLPNNDLFDQIQERCFTEEDYKEKIHAIKKMIELLQSNDVSLNHNVSLNDAALILLSFWSKSISLDENPKLTREAYTLMNDFPENFQIKHLNEKPNFEEIMNALQNKHYFIKQSSEDIPKGSILSTSPLLHKTVIIPTKNGSYCVAMLTSSKTDTELLSKTQECNLDPEGRNKEQRFVVFSHFIICRDDKITVDLRTLGYTHGRNLEGEDVHQKIIHFFEDKKDIWSNNFIQELMVINQEVLKNIALMFSKKNLEIIENNYNNLCIVLKNMTENERERYLKKLLEKRQNEINLQNTNKYLAKLPENFRKLFLLRNHFEKENKEIEETLAMQEKKVEQEKQLQEKQNQKQQEKENRQRTGQLTITEKREALQKRIKDKHKTEQVPEIDDTKTKTILEIEDNKSK